MMEAEAEFLSNYEKMLAAAYDHLVSSGDGFSKVVREIGAIKYKPDTHIFGNVCESIICQQLSTKVADVILSRVIAILPGGVFTPEGLSRVDDADLRKCGVSFRKISYIKEFAENVLQKNVDLVMLWKMSDEDVIDRLTVSRGIGVWTAKMILLFSMGRQDVLPYEDLGIRIAVKKIYGMDTLPGKAEIEALSLSWKPYCSVASMYLWKFKDSNNGK